MTSVTLLFVTLAFLLGLGVPIGISIGLATLAGIVHDGIPLLFFTQRCFNTFDSFPLMAVPFFLLAGDIMQRGTLANSLLGLCQSFVGHRRGGLAHISVLTSLFYGALCGSSAATTAAVGGIMIPAMSREGYPTRFAAAVNAAGGALGVMIPPSIPLILYGASGSVSITDLFIAGIIPGVIVAAGFIVTSHIIIRKTGYGEIHPKAPWRERLHALAAAKWAILVPVIVLGFIYGGITTPTEAGAVAVLYALLVETFITRSLTWNLLKEIMKSSLSTLSVIFLIIITATAMGTFLQFHNLDKVLIDFVHSVTQSQAVFLFIMLIFFLIIGTFMDCSATILIFAPLLVPLARSYGVDPVHFGIFMLVALCTGFLTPPVGTNLFVVCSLTGQNIMSISKEVLPYVLSMIVVLLMLMYIPSVTLFLL